MQLQPFKSLIVIKLDQYPVVGWGEDGKPVVPQIWHKHKPTGTIVAVGPEVTLVKEGDRVAVNPYAIIELPDQVVMLIKEADVLALITKEEEVKETPAGAEVVSDGEQEKK